MELLRQLFAVPQNHLFINLYLGLFVLQFLLLFPVLLFKGPEFKFSGYWIPLSEVPYYGSFRLGVVESFLVSKMFGLDVRFSNDPALFLIVSALMIMALSYLTYLTIDQREIKRKKIISGW
jgi:hypothetical protein